MIILKSKEEYKKLKKCGMIAYTVLKELEEEVRPGRSTEELDYKAAKALKHKGVTSSFLGYMNFPKNICTSVNEEVVHGIPSPKRILKEGDIIKIDLGTSYEGYYVDISSTVPVGKVSPEAERLIAATKEALDAAINEARLPKRIGDLSYVIYTTANKYNYSVVTEFGGHGIGRRRHEAPEVPNFGTPNHGPKLRPGMVLCIEPMLNIGAGEVKILEDGWTVVTKDNSLSAHFEHTIFITEDTPIILTSLE